MGFVVRGYGRASTDHQVLSTEQQQAKIVEGFERRCLNDPNWREVTWGGFFADEATCRESIFRQRHSGSLILAASQPGDIIAVSNFDRLIAGVIDAVETISYINEHKLRLWILDFGGMELDTSTPMGETFLIVMAQFKRLELLDIRRRTRESIAHRKRIGRPYNGKVAIGWKHKLVRVPGIANPQRYPVPDNAARRLAREILRIKNSGKLGCDQASQFCNSLGLKQKNGRRWTVQTFRAWCRAAEADFPWSNGSHEVAPIPGDAQPFIVETIAAED